MVLAALIILSLRYLLPATYRSSAAVTIVRTVSDVSFDERFRTTADETTTDATGAAARRSALLGLAMSGAVATDVIDELHDQLSVKERNPADLLDQISAESGPAIGTRVDSDLVRITARSDTPEKAAAIANAWARAYVRQVNTVYGQVPDEVLASIQTELAKAAATYQKSQANLEANIARNRAEELTRQVTVMKQRLDQEATLVQAELLNWQQANEALNAARALRTQVEKGGEAAARSNMVALQTMKLMVYGNPPATLQLELRDIPEVDQQAMLADIDGLILSLEERLKDLESEVAERTDNLQASATPGQSAATSSTFATLYEQIRQLNAQVEAENAKQMQLAQQRDLDWESYKALSSKVAELNLTRAAASSEVRFAATAVPPREPVDQISLVLGIGIAGLVGLVAAFVFAFANHLMGHTPFLFRAKTQV
ncbi:MAG TPA: hypothetical protein PKE45_15850 [Caldilineaceae bacterium]|nr:hypothetical protein [Caldilineaceae bacterium]